MEKELLEKIKAAGVVGAGGAGFPTHVKVSSSAQYVIVNGAECEPLLKVDQQLLELKAKELVECLEQIVEQTGAQKGIIALKAKYKKALSSLERAIRGKEIELYKLKDFYPAGDEQVTVHEVVKRVVPERAIPLEVGCIVINVETLLNIVNALKGKPVTETYVTITGEVASPLTVKVPLGITVSEAVALAGREELSGMVVIEGGPMMGQIVEPDKPLTKTSKGLIILPAKHSLIKEKSKSFLEIVRQSKAACIQCSRCSDLCPRYLLGHKLEPHKIMRSLSYGKSEVEIVEMAFLCTECGLCEHYGCPMHLSPRQVNARLKKELLAKGVVASKKAQEKARANPLGAYRKVPSKRLKSRLGIETYEHPAPLTEKNLRVTKVSIPVKQHIGKASIPIVEKGQRVKKGELIAKVGENSLGANIHASISGTVSEIGERIVIETERVKKRCSGQ